MVGDYLRQWANSRKLRQHLQQSTVELPDTTQWGATKAADYASTVRTYHLQAMGQSWNQQGFQEFLQEVSTALLRST